MNIRPLGDRVVIKQLAAEEKTKSGLYLADSAKEKPQEGEVLAVGPGKVLESGATAPMPVKVGDIVLFAKYSGTELKHEGETYIILNADRDILAVMDRELN
ncbi:MAG: co-chaperone GroES [Firmicutes bacterium]|nr:co-chaperone GroES [Bacillota bacterium]